MVSCAESEKERLNRLVKEWEGKEILFPTNSTFTIQGKDTVDFDFKDASGNSLEVTQSGSRYYVTFADRKAHQLGEDVIVTITKKDVEEIPYLK